MRPRKIDDGIRYGMTHKLDDVNELLAELPAKRAQEVREFIKKPRSEGLPVYHREARRSYYFQYRGPSPSDDADARQFSLLYWIWDDIETDKMHGALIQEAGALITDRNRIWQPLTADKAIEAYNKVTGKYARKARG